MIHIIGRVGGSRPRTRSQPMIRRPNVEIDHDDSALNTVLRQSNTIPATQSSIQALHKFTLQQHSVEECIICMEEFLVGSVLIRMPCSHVFHGDCIVKWLETSHLCPLCRHSMPH
ncbi:E3 ubiquitin-protein ligase MPSR1-like [Fagus crenata]|uniref:RING-type domain-containing protein n=1 Tax=Fagus sylvatica TaxID=28930 RepID=A0A2N9IFN4_FAGSY